MNEEKKFLDYEGLETLVDIIKSTYAEQDDLTAVSTVATNAAAAVTSLSTNKQDKLIAGTNITIAADGKTISAASTSYEDATQSTHGLMSAADKVKLDGVATGAQVNVIETVKVNGTALTPSSKAVDVTVPTKTSDLTNDSNFVTDASYAHVTVDSALDATSENPVQNKVIKGALDNKLDSSLKGANSGLAELDASGKVPSTQLPSYVDDIIEGYYKAADGKFYEEDTYTTEITGETGKIYVSKDTNKTYRWSGSQFVQVGGGGDLTLGETSSTAYRGDRGKVAYDHSQDANKISSATAAGLYKVGVTAEGHVSTLTAITKEDITALGVPGIDTLYELSTTNDTLKLYGGSAATTTEVPLASNGQIDTLFITPLFDIANDFEEDEVSGNLICTDATIVTSVEDTITESYNSGGTAVDIDIEYIDENEEAVSNAVLTATAASEASVTISSTEIFGLTINTNAETGNKYISLAYSGEE